MARPLRIEVAGGWYHVTARGNERRAVFRDDPDRRHFLELLGEMAQRFSLAVHAYVLMNNHYHLLIETGEANLSRAMQWLGVSYTVWFNRRHGRVGHLFQGRFKAVTLEPNAGAELSRYVHLNPIRVKALGLGKRARQAAAVGLGCAPPAKVVAERLGQLRQYRWSSYRGYVGLEREEEWLASGAVLAMVGGARSEKARWRRRYREYVEEAVREGLEESPWERVQGQVLLGGAEFVRRMRGLVKGNPKEQSSVRQLRARASLERVVAVVEEMKGEGWERWRDRHGDWGRDAVLYLGRRYCGLKLRELGEAVGGIDYRSVGWAVTEFEERLRHDKKLRRLVERAESDFQKQEI